MQLDFLKMNETMVRASEYALNPRQKEVDNNVQGLSRTFSEYLKDSIHEVNDLQMETRSLTQDFMMGKLENAHDLMIASEKAGLAMKTMNTLRRKVLDAYREVSQTRL